MSNLHLGTRDPETGGFVMLGKTFQGVDRRAARVADRELQERAVSDDGWTVTVRPELVVEVAIDGVQTCSRYLGGMALRFARVLRYRWPFEVQSHTPESHRAKEGEHPLLEQRRVLPQDSPRRDELVRRGQEVNDKVRPRIDADEVRRALP